SAAEGRQTRAKRFSNSRFVNSLEGSQRFATYRIAQFPGTQRLSPIPNHENSRRQEMRFTTLSRLLAALAVIAMLLPSVLLAQNTTTGAISGTVSDPSNAVVGNASVVLKSTDTRV